MMKQSVNGLSRKRRSNEGKASTSSSSTSSSRRQRPEVSFHPPRSVLFVSFLLMLLRRRRLLMALCGSWLFLKASHALLVSELFQTRLLLLQFTRAWPPCDLDTPSRPQKLPLFFRWLDWLPSRLGLDDLKSYPGMSGCHVQTVEGFKKRKVGAWLVESNSRAKKPRKGVVLHFKGRASHRGQRSRVKFYERVTREPLDLCCAAFDEVQDMPEDVSERSYLATAHSVWSVLTKPPYSFPAESFVVWGSTFGCCSAANLCLYLMRRGTPPAALVLENPAMSFPRLLASRFEFLGEEIQLKIEAFAKANLVHRFDLEKRIRSICSFGVVNVPILFISAENDWTVPSSHAHRLASIASALAASKRVLLLSLPVTRRELLMDRNFLNVTANFLNQALEDAKQEQNIRRLSVVDFGISPSTWSLDPAAEDKIFDEETADDPPFGL